VSVAKEGAVLKLTVEQSGDLCRIVAEFNSKEREVEVGMLPNDFRSNLESLQTAILQSPGARTAQPLGPKNQNPAPAVPPDNKPKLRAAAGALTTGSDEIIVREIGSQLFAFIFQRGVLDLYNECYASTKKLQQPLSIRLHVKHPGLSYVPWETLYDKTNGFYVTASQETPFTRAVQDEDDDIAPGGGRPIRVLAMAARAKVMNGILLDSIDADAEQVAIDKALEGVARTKIKFCWTLSAQARDLNRRFIKGDDGKRWDIFHFIGHGGHDPEKKTGFIVVQEEGGVKGSPLYADDLRAFVCQPGRTPGLVVLNSCSGAQAEPGMLFSSVAEELIRGGVPAVIAMQFEISDNMGIEFSNTFYSYLVENLSIQSALAHTRRELKARSYGEWISPVLYMRGFNGEIFIDTGAA
jgi:hypothetical protein